MELHPTRRGMRLMHGRHIVSEVLRAPGPTHSVFDVLAALVPVLGVRSPVALLGFAGGGTVAALRALHASHEVQAVDLASEGPRLFRKLSRGWAGETHFTRADAVRWLRAQRRRFGAVIDDLSIEAPGDVLKPDVSLSVLPELTAARLRPDGLSIVNGLPVPGLGWRDTEALHMASYASVRAIHFVDYENRILVGGADLPLPWRLAHALDVALGKLGSRMRGLIRVHARR